MNEWSAVLSLLNNQSFKQKKCTIPNFFLSSCTGDCHRISLSSWGCPSETFEIFDVIYQTRETVFHRDIKNTDKRVENTTRSGVLLTNDETLSRVFDISSQFKQKLKSERRGKIVKIYAN